MKRNVLLRVASLALVLLMLLAIVCSCSPDSDKSDQPDDPNKPDDPNTPGDGDDSDDTNYTANVPAGYTCNDETFTVYAYPEDVFVWKDFDWQNNGIDGDRIGSAVYKRTSKVEEDLHVTIEYYCGNSYSDPAEFRTSASTGEGAFDIANVTMLNHISMVQQGLLAEINSYGKLDLTAPWWDQNILPDLSINHMNFCLTGDIGTMYKRCIACIIFNKEMLSSNNLENPYPLVTGRKWTLETMVEMGQQVSEDLDANDAWNEKDRFGLIYFSDVLSAMEISCGVPYATKNEDDIPEVTLYCDEAIDVLETAAELLFDETLSYNVTSHGQDESLMWSMFMNNQALFYYGELHSAEDMRASDYDFGILPMPLYDDTQEEYRHTVNPNVAAVLVIPLDNTAEERTSYILDSLGAASKNLLTPAYYDLNLKGVTTRDTESTVSLDIIISTMSYDMGYLYLADTGAMLRDLCNTKSTAFASKYKTYENSLNSTIEKIVKALEDRYS